mmetsp:Transcript_22374/g.46843  ORF Transcript_22374/g.46843 Transcript_22374/m.46843 type:complete len:599 (-) Transcript_22374:202-1998(-)
MFDFIFPEPQGMQPQMLFWIFITYGYILFTAANMLSDGSELLLFIPQVAGLVGSVVLPVLGAVPDGMMVLFSGIGPTEVAQENVAVGVGALAGSTIMLLTVPWFLGVLGGRVDMEGGKCQYGEEKKLTKGGLMNTFFHTGIRYKPEIRANCKIMIFTALTYLIIQIPAWFIDTQEPALTAKAIAKENSQESAWALIGMVFCILEFSMYLYMQYVAGLPEQHLPHSVSSAEMLRAQFDSCLAWVRDKMSGAGVAPAKARSYVAAIMRAQELGVKAWMEEFRRDWKLTEQSEKNKALLDKVTFPKDFRETLAMWFRKYASASDHDGLRMTEMDFNNLLRALHLHGYNATELFQQVDANNDGSIDSDEFTECFKHLASLPPKAPAQPRKSRATIATAEAVTLPAAPAAAEKADQDDDDDDEDEEEESMPEEFKDLSVQEQRRQILLKSSYLMGFGTLLVLVFSDPMVDVLAEIGRQSGIPSFYISFVLAPMASNSSELVAAYNYAKKRTCKSITTSLSTLEGAAIMNNTFCLGIFLGLVYFQNLAWEFSAETTSILLIEVLMALSILFRRVHRLLDAFFILSLYPLCLATVYVLENSVGWD